MCIYLREKVAACRRTRPVRGSFFSVERTPFEKLGDWISSHRATIVRQRWQIVAVTVLAVYILALAIAN